MYLFRIGSHFVLMLTANDETKTRKCFSGVFCWEDIKCCIPTREELSLFNRFGVGIGEQLCCCSRFGTIYYISGKKHDRCFMQQCCNHDTNDVIQTICETKLELLYSLHKGPLLSVSEGKCILWIYIDASSYFSESVRSVWNGLEIFRLYLKSHPQFWVQFNFFAGRKIIF